MAHSHLFGYKIPRSWSFSPSWFTKLKLPPFISHGSVFSFSRLKQQGISSDMMIKRLYEDAMEGGTHEITVAFDAEEDSLTLSLNP